MFTFLLLYSLNNLKVVQMLKLELYGKLFLLEQQMLKAKQECVSQCELDALRKQHEEVRYQIHKARHPEF